jgi:hypothetical protein
LDTKSSYHSEASSLVRGNCSEATSPVEQALCTPSTCTARLSRAHQHCGQRRQATSSSASSRHHWNTKLLELGNGYGALISSHHSEVTRSVRGRTHTCTSPLSRTSSTVDKQRVVCMPACQQHASSMQAGSAPSMRYEQKSSTHHCQTGAPPLETDTQRCRPQKPIHTPVRER